MKTIKAKHHHKKKKSKKKNHDDFDKLFNDLNNIKIKTKVSEENFHKKKKKDKKKKSKKKKPETFLDKLARVCHLDTKVNVKVTDESISCIGIALVGLLTKLLIKDK